MNYEISVIDLLPLASRMVLVGSCGLKQLSINLLFVNKRKFIKLSVDLGWYEQMVLGHQELITFFVSSEVNFIRFTQIVLVCCTSIMPEVKW